MPIFYIHATNSSFRSSAPAANYDTADAALKVGIKSALDIATEEVRDGMPNPIVEVCIADLDNVVVLRSAVSVSVSRLLPT